MEQTNSARLTIGERDAIVQPLRAGVVPLTGLNHFQVGREHELASLKCDLDRIAKGGTAIRFIVGDYGAGKTFILNSIKNIALKNGQVVTSTDLSRDKRLSGSRGQSRRLYSSLIRHLSTQARPMRNALDNIVERFVMATLRDAAVSSVTTDEAIAQRLSCFEEMAGGFDFIHVILKYWQGINDNSAPLKTQALRWIKAEFNTQSEARRALGVRTIIGDDNSFDCLKMMAKFIRMAGYNGLVVELDEMTSLCNIDNHQARNNNYDTLLSYINECWLGTSPDLGLFCFSTHEFMNNEKRGIVSHRGLCSRLAPNAFAVNGLTDWSSTVLYLSHFTRAEVQQLLSKLWDIYQSKPDLAFNVNQNDILRFIDYAQQHWGARFQDNPRLTIKTFLDYLAIREYQPSVDCQRLFHSIDPTAALDSMLTDAETVD
jgi:BREX system ATP-binding protein BrxC/D